MAQRRPISDDGAQASARAGPLGGMRDRSCRAQITRGTLELLSLGDELATRLGGALVAVGFPAAIARHAGLLASYGADHIVRARPSRARSHTRQRPQPRHWRDLVRERDARGACCSTRASAAATGARGWRRVWAWGSLATLSASSSTAKRRMVALKPAFGGNIVAPIFSKTFPQMATVRPGVLELGEPTVLARRRPRLSGPSSSRR